jgi:quercetin dioxygenase-like cupin family protein
MNEMLTRRYASVLLATAATSVLVYGGTAHANPTPTPISIEVLTPRAAFTDDVSLQANLKLDGHGSKVIKSSNASRVVTTKVTMQPGAQVPWHTHHGPVFITIGQGELTYVSSDDCVSRVYPAETAFVERGHGHVQMIQSTGEGPAVFLATFFEVPEGTGPITIPTNAPVDCNGPTN